MHSYSNRKFKAAIFDVDGTLLDSMFMWGELFIAYLEQRNLPVPDDLIDGMRPLTIPQMGERFANALGVNEPPETIARNLTAYIDDFYANRARLKGGIREYLSALAKDGVRMVIATATPRHNIEAALTRVGIRQYFEQIFTCPEIGIGKDKPDIFLLGAEYLGTKPSETVVFEDAIFAIRSATSAGFPVIGLYDPTSARDTNEIRSLCTAYIGTFLNI